MNKLAFLSYLNLFKLIYYASIYLYIDDINIMDYDLLMKNGLAILPTIKESLNGKKARILNIQISRVQKFGFFLVRDSLETRHNMDGDF